MRLNYIKISKKIKKNIELFLLIVLVFISVVITQIYNLNKQKINQNYLNLINNTYFQKTLNHVFNSLEPKNIDISHKIIRGDTFDKILSSYNIPTNEIKKIKKKLYNSNKKNLNK